MLFQPMSDYPLYPPISFTIGLRKIHLSVALRTPCTQSKKQNCFTYFRIADRISNILPDLHPGNLFPLPFFVNYSGSEKNPRKLKKHGNLKLFSREKQCYTCIRNSRVIMYIMYSAKLFHLLKYAFFLSIFKLDCRKIKSFDKVSFEFDHYLSYLWSFICSILHRTNLRWRYSLLIL